jgi:succinate dehydrogenase/fumarate reductase flavoprotein subunit
MGNALVGRLLLSLRERSVPIRREAQVTGLIEVGGRVAGVEVRHEGATEKLSARLGVVLAGGGFNDNPSLRARLIPPEVRYSPRAGTSTGALQEFAIGLGARLGRPDGGAAFWAPVSTMKRRDGSTAVFPHFVLDRAKPGTVVVNSLGRRFVNESTSYHLFGERMLESRADDPADGRSNASAYLIADQRALVKYGLGMIRPGGRGLERFLREGYLVQAPTIGDLADKLGIECQVLQGTVERMNLFALHGVDEDFRRGETVYQKNLGDPAVQPNPTLGPIREAPFSAIRLHVGDIGACAGLVTDAHGRVLADAGPIPGLFAIGNDMQSVMGGAYPGPGINLGPAIVFAYAAVQAARRLGESSAAEQSARRVT